MRRLLNGWKKLNDEIFAQSRENKKFTRREKRENPLLYNQEQVTSEPPRHIFDTTMDQFRSLQESDPTLETIREAAKGHPSTAGVGFFEKEGLIYRRWIP